MNLEKSHIDLLCNTFKMKPTMPDKTPNIYAESMLDLLNSRLELGKKKYGHGVIVDDDTTSFGTRENDWELMALEEMLDGIIYTAAAIIRFYRNHKINISNGENNGENNGDDNEEIMEIIRRFIYKKEENKLIRIKVKNWELTALDEMLDSLINVTNMIIKYRERKQQK